MKIILKENFETLGKAGEIVKVADGYARNFLIPKGIAAEANLRNIKALEHDKQNIVRKAEKERKRHESLAASLSGVTCTIARRVGEQDKLFGSVTAMDIEEALLAQNVKKLSSPSWVESCWIMSRCTVSWKFCRSPIFTARLIGGFFPRSLISTIEMNPATS